MNGDLYSWLDEFVLVVLGFPVVAAVVVGLASLAGGGAARRAAGYLSAVQLVLTVGLVVVAGAALSQSGRRDIGTFQPIGVPGGPVGGQAQSSIGFDTSWAVLAVGDTAANLPRVHFFVGLDGLNLPLVALTGLMFFLAILVSWDGITDRPGGYYAWLFLLQAGVTGAFVALDVLLFYACFELTLIPAFFLIGYWGVGAGKRDAARKFVLYTLTGSLLTLVGIVGVVLANPDPIHPFTGRVMDRTRDLVADPANPAGERRPPVRGPITFSIPRLIVNHTTWQDTSAAKERLFRRMAERPGAVPYEQTAMRAAVEGVKADRAHDRWVQGLLFLALIAGFAVKTPLVPFHTWLPAAYSEAPLAVTMILSAVVAKLGTFGILRVVLPLCPEAALDYGLYWVAPLGAAGVVYAALCAYAQHDLKLLAAYSSVSHLGFVVMALFAGTPEATAGAVLHMVNHGLTAGGLFALLAYLHHRYGTTDGNAFGGLIVRHPGFAFYFFVLSLAAVGLPGLCAFVSEMLMLAGLFDPRVIAVHGYGLQAVAAAGLFLGAWYTFTMIRRVFFGPLREPAEVGPVTGGLTGREAVTLGGLSAVCLALGLFPQPVLDVIRPDASRVAHFADEARAATDPATAVRPNPDDDERMRNAVRPQAAGAVGGVGAPRPAPKRPMP